MFRLLKSVSRSVASAIRHDPEVERFGADHPRLVRFLSARFGSDPFGLRLTIGIALTITFLFLFLSVVQDLIARDPLVEADLRVASAVQIFRDPVLDRLMIIVTYLGNWQVVVSGAVLVIVYLAVLRRGFLIATLLISMIGGELIVWALKDVFLRPRPDQINALVPAAGPSFPSGHTLVAFAFYGLLAWFVIVASRSRWMKSLVSVVALAGIIVLGFSRVYVGAHWPSDVLASLTLGAAWLAAVITGAMVFGERTRQTNPPALTTRTRALAASLLAIWLAFVGTFEYLQPTAKAPQRLPPAIALSAAAFPQNLFATIPRFSEDIVGKPMEPINVILVGSEGDVSKAFEQAGWAPTDGISWGSSWRLLSAVLLNRPYDRAPGTPSFWRGEPNEHAFEKPTAADTARERHHLHLWATEFLDAGEPVWVGTVHRDKSDRAAFGITLPIHEIDPAIDREREIVGADLARATCFERSEDAKVTDPMLGQNASKSPFFTDGRALLVFLKCPI